jgi:hypothetical protein
MPHSLVVNIELSNYVIYKFGTYIVILTSGYYID